MVLLSSTRSRTSALQPTDTLTIAGLRGYPTLYNICTFTYKPFVEIDVLIRNSDMVDRGKGGGVVT